MPKEVGGEVSTTGRARFEKEKKIAGNRSEERKNLLFLSRRQLGRRKGRERGPIITIPSSTKGGEGDALGRGERSMFLTSFVLSTGKGERGHSLSAS